MPSSKAQSDFAIFQSDFGLQNNRNHFRNRLGKAPLSSTVNDPILSHLYLVHSDGLRQPSDGALLDCLKKMLTVDKLATYIILDALDECPTISFPSARQKVLGLVTDLVKLKKSNLHLCVTSRLEADVRTALEPLASHSVSLHNQKGQMEDINNYISFFVNSDGFMDQSREEERNLVIKELRQQAAGM